jgi:pilus assembly protein Flp/PilA
MKNCKLLLHSFFQDESGQDLIEYALVAALIGLGSVATMSTLAGDIESTFGSIGTALTSAVA